MSVGVWLIAARSAVPSFNGRTLDDWLSEKEGIAPISDEAAAAIRNMGTNALPRLLELLSHEDSAIRAWAYVHLPGWSPVSLTPYYVIQGRGAEGIKALGSSAKPAVPALARMFYNSDNGSQSDVAEALMAIGPEGVSIVQGGLTNANPMVRCAAVTSLSEMAATNTDVLAAFHRALTDPNHHVREAATNALKELRERTGEPSGPTPDLK